MWITVVVTVTRTHTIAHTTPTEPQTFICKSYKPGLIVELSASPMTLHSGNEKLRAKLTRSPYLCFRLASSIVKRPIRISWNCSLIIHRQFARTEKTESLIVQSRELIFNTLNKNTIASPVEILILLSTSIFYLIQLGFAKTSPSELSATMT